MEQHLHGKALKLYVYPWTRSDMLPCSLIIGSWRTLVRSGRYHSLLRHCLTAFSSSLSHTIPPPPRRAMHALDRLPQRRSIIRVYCFNLQKPCTFKRSFYPFHTHPTVHRARLISCSQSVRLAMQQTCSWSTSRSSSR